MIFFNKMIGLLKISCGAQNIEVIAYKNVCILESQSFEAGKWKV
jgi:hypothetical protein